MNSIYEDISTRTNGDVYIGVVGPVRCGKSTFIKKFMESSVIPNIADENEKQRAIDELPQSAAGRTVMTAEPKFIPENPVNVEIGNSHMKIKMVDCVGYLVNGALGTEEDGKVRMVNTPWDKTPVPFEEAAEKGTEKVIKEHSTVGIVVTSDGSFGDIKREDYVSAEERIINDVKELDKPFIIILNSATPENEESVNLALALEEKYAMPVALLNCAELDSNDAEQILGMLTFEFSISEINFCVPDWVCILGEEHELKKTIVKEIKDIAECSSKLSDCAYINRKREVDSNTESYMTVNTVDVDLANGTVNAKITVDESAFYSVIRETSGIEINCKSDLLREFCSLSESAKRFKKYESAIDDAESMGYGVVEPTIFDMDLEMPEIISRQGEYGVSIKANASSVHIIKASISTEVSPIVGTQKQSEELINALTEEYENGENGIWESNMFGKSIYDLVSEGFRVKLCNIPTDAGRRLSDTVSRIINEGANGLICIIM